MTKADQSKRRCPNPYCEHGYVKITSISLRPSPLVRLLALPRHRKGDLMPTEIGPHSFSPLRFWDALYGGGRCRACFAPRYAHPMHCWVQARPLGDRRKAELSFEALSGKSSR